MNTVLKLISAIGLALTGLPAFFVFSGQLTWETHARLMLIGTVLWFCTAPLWITGAKPRLWFWKRHRPI